MRDYQKELEFDKKEFECNLRHNISKTEEFKKLFPNLDLSSISYSKEEREALNYFILRHWVLYERIKLEVRVEFALTTLERRCAIENYKRVHFPLGDDYGDTEDVISVCSDEDLLTLFDLIKKIRLKKP